MVHLATRSRQSKIVTRDRSEKHCNTVTIEGTSIERFLDLVRSDETDVTTVLTRQYAVRLRYVYGTSPLPRPLGTLQ